ncbi:MAG: hypothetical protein WA081_09175 [Desulfosalsimonadaceae bacterium]
MIELSGFSKSIVSAVIRLVGRERTMLSIVLVCARAAENSLTRWAKNPAERKISPAGFPQVKYQLADAGIFFPLPF